MDRKIDYFEDDVNDDYFEETKEQYFGDPFEEVLIFKENYQ